MTEWQRVEHHLPSGAMSSRVAPARESPDRNGTRDLAWASLVRPTLMMQQSPTSLCAGEKTCRRESINRWNDLTLRIAVNVHLSLAASAVKICVASANSRRASQHQSGYGRGLEK